MSTTNPSLATTEQAELILHLYELRTEETMRKARHWFAFEFWPTSADDFFAVMNDFASPHNAYFRQVHSYWEMAAAFVLHGALSADLFFDTNGENLFLMSKLVPFIQEIRAKNAGIFAKTQKLVDADPVIQQRLASMVERNKATAAAASKA
jgi:hypothetical protein